MCSNASDDEDMYHGQFKLKPEGWDLQQADKSQDWESNEELVENYGAKQRREQHGRRDS